MTYSLAIITDPEARLQANVPIPKDLIEEARNPE